MDLNLENPKLSAPPPSSTASSATRHPLRHSRKQLQYSDLSRCQRAHTEHTQSQEVSEGSGSPKYISLSPPNMEAPEIKISPTSDNKKGKDNSLQSRVPMSVFHWHWSWYWNWYCYRYWHWDWYRYRSWYSISNSSFLSLAGHAKLGALTRGPHTPKCPKPCAGLPIAEKENQKGKSNFNGKTKN